MVAEVESCNVETAHATLGGLFVQEALKDFFFDLGVLAVLHDLQILFWAERFDFNDDGSIRRKANLRLQPAL